MRHTLIPAFLFVATSALAEVPNVATDILPVHGLVSRVMEGVGTPDLIVPPNASPHGHAMRPSEAAALERADVVFWIGEELTNWLQEPIEVLAADARHVALLDEPGTILRKIGGDDDEDHEDEHEEGHEGDHVEVDDHGHHHEGTDPHAWLDPENARLWVGIIARELSVIDPDNAAIYAANASEAKAEYAEMSDKVRDQMRPLASIGFAVFHDALGYYEDRFGIKARFAIKSWDEEKPAPRRIAELRERAQIEDVRLIFGESQAEGALVDTVFEGRSVTYCMIDFLGNDIARGPNHYRQLFEAMASRMNDCAQKMD